MPHEEYEERQRMVFGQLVREGAYSAGFRHTLAAQEFFAEVMRSELARFTGRDVVSILDCGCGSGAWLECVLSLVPRGVRGVGFGFDLTPEMVDVAGAHLSSVGLEAQLWIGDVLEESAYDVPAGPQGFDVVYSYDVVQQLPRRRQFEALEVMLKHVAPGGSLIVFDNDCQSAFGRRMAVKKWITQYLGIELVPPYYCNAKYPPLALFSKRLARISGTTCQVTMSPQRMKRALIARRKKA